MDSTDLYLCAKVPAGIVRLVGWLWELAPVALRTLRMGLLTADRLPAELGAHREALCDWIEARATGCGADVLAVFPVLDPAAFKLGCDLFRSGRY
jgi:hypothetical protein